MKTARFSIGTAQFGTSYGISNYVGQVVRRDATEILEYAKSSGIDAIDTAIAYGESEQRLGEIGVQQFQVVSKLPAIPPACRDVPKWIRESVLGSLTRLNIPKLYGLLLHHPQQLLTSHGDQLYRTLITLRDEGKVEKIGISIYSPEELDKLWPNFQFDLVQAPFNIIDQRLVSSQWLARLHQEGVEVHIRSIFLQGLLLMNTKSRPATFSKWNSIWDEWHCWLDEQAMTPLQACLGFAMMQQEIDRIVIGVDSLEQLKAIVSEAAAPNVVPPLTLASHDLDLVDPSRWKIV